MEDYIPTLSEEERAARRAQRAEARRQKQQARRRRQLKQLLPFCLVLAILVGLLAAWAFQHQPETSADPPAAPVSVSQPAEEPEAKPVVFAPHETDATIQLGEDFASQYAVVIDTEDGSIVAEKNADTVISPASMTKILTLLVAAEHLENLEDTVTITIDITDYCYTNDCSVVGFALDEVVPVRELLYGTILPSGADAALALAKYVAGSQEAFVTLMNEKLEELGLSDTAHFTNCVGLYNEAHACTVTDMALILKAAMENDLCQEVLSAHTYETAPTTQHPEGQILSNWFLRRIEDKDTGGIEVTGAKTGYVVESGNCAASCGETADGRRYICVTADAYSSWRAIYDHVALYKTYCSPADDTTEDGGAADPLVEPVAPTIKDTTEHESGASL